jgi:hypothetical protein
MIETTKDIVAIVNIKLNFIAKKIIPKTIPIPKAETVTNRTNKNNKNITRKSFIL